jgi:hypothetical protein
LDAVESAVRLLEANGYRVIPKERVRRLSVSSVLHHHAIRVSKAEGSYLVDAAKRTITNSMGREVMNLVPIVSTDRDDWPGGPVRVFEARVDVILPKQKEDNGSSLD